MTFDELNKVKAFVYIQLNKKCIQSDLVKLNRFRLQATAKLIKLFTNKLLRIVTKIY